MSEEKRCPFRKDEDGEFAPCYGAACMAYLECDTRPFNVITGEGEKQESQHVIMCRMMNPPYFVGGCNI